VDCMARLGQECAEWRVPEKRQWFSLVPGWAVAGGQEPSKAIGIACSLAFQLGSKAKALMARSIVKSKSNSAK